MENILAIIVVVAGVVLATLVTRYIYKRVVKSIADKREAEEVERKRQLEATRKWRESLREKSLSNAVKNTSSVPPRGKETTATYKPSYTPSPTQSVKSDDGFMDGVMTAMVINTLMDSGKDFISGTVTKNEDTGSVGIKVSESSWGFDDEDSRKSVSSTFSSSDSSSSWSSDSSDSGPSSDW